MKLVFMFKSLNSDKISDAVCLWVSRLLAIVVVVVLLLYVHGNAMVVSGR